MAVRIRWGYSRTELRSACEHLAKNLILGIPGASRARLAVLGSAHWSLEYDELWIERRSAQLRQLLQVYREAWGDWAWIEGKTVLEVGSGTDLAVPNALCALGAARAYASDVEPCGTVALPEPAVAAYRDIAAEHLAPGAALTPIEPIQSRIETVYPVHLESLSDSFCGESLDLIVSTSVLEHVMGAEKAIGEMWRALRPGGRMIHAIAMGNHCCDDLADPLVHLIYPDWLWRAMFSNRVGLNRLRWFEWREILEAGDFALDHVQVSSVDRGRVLEKHPRMAKRFRAMDPDLLEPKYVVVACRKVSSMKTATS